MNEKAVDAISAYCDLPLTPVNVNNPSEGYSLFFHLYINDLDAAQTFGVKLVGPVVELDGLKKSIRSSGIHPIFVCICGDPGCESVWVETELLNDAVKWKCVYGYDAEGKPGGVLSQCDYTFSIAELNELVGSLDEIIQLYAQKKAPIPILGPKGPYLK